MKKVFFGICATFIMFFTLEEISIAMPSRIDHRYPPNISNLIRRFEAGSLQRDHLFRMAASIILDQSNPTEALSVLRQLQEANIRPNFIVYNSVLYFCARTGTWEGVAIFQRLLTEMSNYGISLSASVKTSVINASLLGVAVENNSIIRELYAEMRNIESAPGLVTQSVRATPVTFDQSDSVNSNSRNMDTHGGRDGIRIYGGRSSPNISVAIHRFQAGEIQISHLLKIATSVISMQSDLDGALSVLRQLQQANITPDLITYNSVIHVCQRIGTPEAARVARELCDEMIRNVKLIPSVIADSSVNNASAQDGTMETDSIAHELQTEMRNVEITPGEVTPSLRSTPATIDQSFMVNPNDQSDAVDPNAQSNAVNPNVQSNAVNPNDQSDWMNPKGKKIGAQFGHGGVRIYGEWSSQKN